ncbi:hypothetical protein SteCoe_19716 [Stentor coeruleus]|uniref:Uncharacterized protein n=1 Tax=Stentor coeruleus TaxID=5963 RepID=A0A1R2BTI3_9CILI|nr:hypothetical protein SteCoe_19716 [Stentor coeruleus]
MFGVYIYYQKEVFDLLDITFPTCYCSIQDIYFAYLISVCNKLSENRRLFYNETRVVRMNPESDNGIPVATEYKEVIAYPKQPKLPCNCVCTVYDFSKGYEEKAITGEDSER